jgi:DNA-binding HxlR family transcriptional regulator
MATRYSHFCPVARSLERIGDRWSLLIVRDLLQGPQRFTDLIGSLSHITPKWLTLRLRELASAGIVERQCQPGRREVWYLLTPAGKDLGPVVEALVEWGLRHAMHPPVPGEFINIGRVLSRMVESLNKRGKQLSRPAVCSVKFPQSAFILAFRDKWACTPGEVSEPEIKIQTTPETMAAFCTVHRSERDGLFQTMQVEGEPKLVGEFRKILGIPDKKMEEA